MNSHDDPRDTPMNQLRQEYAENELDHDRNPTEDGFVEWLARRVTATRPTPHLDTVKAERDAALARAESHRQAAHEAAGQLDALRRERDRLLVLIRDLADADDCWFDHHGGCQAHGYLALAPGETCPHAEAKEILGGIDIHA